MSEQLNVTEYSRKNVRYISNKEKITKSIAPLVSTAAMLLFFKLNSYLGVKILQNTYKYDKMTL